MFRYIGGNIAYWLFDYIYDWLRTRRCFRSTSVVKLRCLVLTIVVTPLLFVQIIMVSVLMVVSWQISIYLLSMTAGEVVVVLTALLFTLTRPGRRRFLAWAFGDEVADEVSDDLAEVYLREREIFGDARARQRYRRALLSLTVRRFWHLAVRLALKRRA
jgi:hypothetical protein